MSTIKIDAGGTLAEMDLPECDVCNKTIIEDNGGRLDTNLLYETAWSGIYVCDDDDCKIKVIEANAVEMCVEIS